MTYDHGVQILRDHAQQNRPRNRHEIKAALEATAEAPTAAWITKPRPPDVFARPPITQLSGDAHVAD